MSSSRRISGRPSEIVLDLDATDDPIHGQQEGRFFHGYYDCYCYLPLYIFCGRHLLAAKLRRSNIDARGGRRARRSRASWRRSAAAGPRCGSCCAPTRALPRDLMAWCEAQRRRLRVRPGPQRRGWSAEIAAELAEAPPRATATGQPARRFKDFQWTTLDSWSCRAARGRQGRAHRRARPIRASSSPHSAGSAPTPAALYEDALLRARRDGEPHQGVPARPVRRPHLDGHHARQPAAPVVRLDGLCADRCACAASGSPAPSWPMRPAASIRLKLLKIGALVRISVRRVKIAMASSHPRQRDWAIAYAALDVAP